METPRPPTHPASGWRLRFLIIWCFTSAPLPATPPDWHSDFDTAVEQAGITGKENLLIFTGLGWEEWSHKLRDEVLDTPEFQQSIRENLILTHIDLPETPRTGKAPDEKELRRHQLARDFKLHVFPSIYLCTSDGRPYALLGYMEGGPQPLLRAIHEKRTAHAETMRAIHQLTGPGYARALDAWLETIPPPLHTFHRDKIEKLIAADPENQTGLRTKHQLALMLPAARHLRYTDQLDQAETLYQQIIEQVKPTGQDLQQIHYELADIHFARKDYDRLLDTLDLALEAAPQGERADVLREMMEVFTRQWILTKHHPQEMQAVHHDHTRLTLTPAETTNLLKQIPAAKKIAPTSTRNQTLDTLARELREKAPQNQHSDR